MKCKFKVGDEVIIKGTRKGKYRADVKYCVGKITEIVKSTNPNKGNCIYSVEFNNSKRLYRFRSYDLCLYVKRETHESILDEGKLNIGNKQHAEKGANQYEWTITSTIGRIVVI